MLGTYTYIDATKNLDKMKKRLRFSMPHTPLRNLNGDVVSENYQQNDVYNISSEDDESDVMTSECVSEYSDVSDDYVDDDVSSRRRSSGSSRSRQSSKLSQKREGSIPGRRNRNKLHSTRSSCSSCGADIDLSGLRPRYNRQGSHHSARRKHPSTLRSVSIKSKNVKNRNEDNVVDITQMPDDSRKNHFNANDNEQKENMVEGTPIDLPKTQNKTKVKISEDLEAEGHSSTNETDELIWRSTKTEATSKSKKPTEDEDIELKPLNRNVSEA